MNLSREKRSVLPKPIIVDFLLFLPQPDFSNDRGWSRNRDGGSEGRRLVRLRRVTDTAEEGVFTCNIPGDINTPRYLGVYYPSELLCVILMCMKEGRDRTSLGFPYFNFCA